MYSKLIPGLTENHIKGNGRPGKHVSSPLAKDSNPSMQIRVGKSGNLVYKCFATGANGDEIDLFARCRGLDPKHDFPMVLQKINEEFNLGLNGQAKTYTNWGCEYEDHLTEQGQQWADKFKIRNEILSKYNVGQIKEAWFVGENERKFKFKYAEQGRLAFNFAVSGLKIYQPGIDGQEKKVYRGPGSTNDDIFGLAQLPSRKVDILLILEGEKDVLCAASHGFHAVSFQSAGYRPTKAQIRRLKEKANQLIVCYDNDDPGQKAAKWIYNKFDIPHYELPEGYNDISDYLPVAESHKTELTRNLELCWQDYREKNRLFLIERWGKYWRPAWDKDSGKTEWSKLTPVSNFVIEVEAFIYSSNDSKRVVKLINEKGLVKQDAISTDVFSSLAEFKKFAGKNGNFIFYGTGSDLTALQRMTFELSENADEVTEWGYSKRHDLWVWGNGIFKNGKFMKPDQFGMVEGLYLPWTAQENEFDDDYLEVRSYEFKESEIGIGDWYLAMGECYGYKAATLGAAFMVAALHFDHIAKERKRFPELLVWGQRGSGKNSFIEFLLYPIGEIQPGLLTSSTKSSLARTAAQAGNFPMWFDEYGKGVGVSEKEVLKGFYDLSSRGTGVKSNDNRTKKGKVIRPTIITGQELPSDNEALLSRMLVIQFDQVKDDPDRRRKYEEWKLKLRGKMGKVFRQIVANREVIIARYDKKFRELSLQMSNEMISANLVVDSRLIENYASVLAPLVIALEEGLPILGNNLGKEELSFGIDNVITAVMDFMKKQAESEAKSDEVNVFWEYFITLVQKSVLQKDLHYTIQDVKGTKYFGFRTISVEEVKQHFRRVNNAELTDAVIDYMQKRPYYSESNSNKLSYYRDKDSYEKYKDVDHNDIDENPIRQRKGHVLTYIDLPDFVKEFFNE